MFPMPVLPTSPLQPPKPRLAHTTAVVQPPPVTAAASAVTSPARTAWPCLSNIEESPSDDSGSAGERHLRCRLPSPSPPNQPHSLELQLTA